MLESFDFIFDKYQNILIAIIAVIGVVFTAFVALRNNSKNLFVKSVTDERAKWRSELRDASAQFISLVYEQAGDRSSDHLGKIIALKTQIKLRTNPSQENKHELDKNINLKLKEIVDLIDKNVDKEKVALELACLEINIQKLLKQEWDKSKREAKFGKMSK